MLTVLVPTLYNTSNHPHQSYFPYRSYPAKMRCLVTYKLGSGCKKLTFGCPKSKFDISNKDKKKCRKGDVLIIGKKRWVKL